MTTYTDGLWESASADHRADRELELLSAASVGAAQITAFMLASESSADFGNRLALMEDRIHAVAASVAPEGSPDYMTVVAKLPEQMHDQWQTAFAHRQAEAQRRNAPRAARRAAARKQAVKAYLYDESEGYEVEVDVSTADLNGVSAMLMANRLFAGSTGYVRLAEIGDDGGSRYTYERTPNGGFNIRGPVGLYGPTARRTAAETQKVTVYLLQPPESVGGKDWSSNEVNRILNDPTHKLYDEVSAWHNSSFRLRPDSVNDLNYVKAISYDAPASSSDEDICDQAFQEFNIGEGPLARAYRADRNRSLSVGDIIVIGGRAWGCASFGWERLPNFKKATKTAGWAPEVQADTLELGASKIQQDMMSGDPPKVGIVRLPDGSRRVIEVAPIAFGPRFSDLGSYEQFYGVTSSKVAYTADDHRLLTNAYFALTGNHLLSEHRETTVAYALDRMDVATALQKLARDAGHVFSTMDALLALDDAYRKVGSKTAGIIPDDDTPEGRALRRDVWMQLGATEWQEWVRDGILPERFREGPKDWFPVRSTDEAYGGGVFSSRTAAIAPRDLANKTLDEVDNWYRQGVIGQDLYEAYMHAWATHPSHDGYSNGRGWTDPTGLSQTVLDMAEEIRQAASSRTSSRRMAAISTARRRTAAIAPRDLANKTLDEVDNWYRQGVIGQDLYEAYMHAWATHPSHDGYSNGRGWTDPTGLSQTVLDMAEEIRQAASSRTSSRSAAAYELECYGCGKKGDNTTFGLGNKRQCPDCGSYEIHLPEAHDNWKSSSRRTAAIPTGRSDYSPARARVGDPSPQTDPDAFSSEDILAEIKYLMRANEKYGEHPLRTTTYLRLMRVLQDRGFTASRRTAADENAWPPKDDGEQGGTVRPDDPNATTEPVIAQDPQTAPAGGAGGTPVEQVAEGDTILEAAGDKVTTFTVNTVADEGETVLLSVTKDGTEPMDLRVPKTEQVQTLPGAGAPAAPAEDGAAPSTNPFASGDEGETEDDPEAEPADEEDDDEDEDKPSNPFAKKSRRRRRQATRRTAADPRSLIPGTVVTDGAREGRIVEAAPNMGFATDAFRVAWSDGSTTTIGADLLSVATGLLPSVSRRQATIDLGNGLVAILPKTAGEGWETAKGPVWFEENVYWTTPHSRGPHSGVPEDLFPDGIPLRGDLTPEQQAWLDKRSARSAGRIRNSLVPARRRRIARRVRGARSAPGMPAKVDAWIDNWDSHDEWGSAMEVAWGLAEALAALGDRADIDHSFGAGGSPSLDEIRNDADGEHFTAQAFIEGIDRGELTVADLHEAVAFIDKYLDKLKAEGKDY